MKTIIIYGLRRSGNHFLISTILNKFNNHVHLNDVILSYDLYQINKDKEITINYSDNKWKGFKGTDCLIISMEDKEIDFNELEKFNNIEDCHKILLLRSPYTNFSSLWKVSKKKKKKKIPELIILWEKYANYFIEDNNFVKVLYDELATNNKYKNNILKKMNINTKDVNNYISKYQKSSFNNEKTSHQVYKNLNNCIFCKDLEFCELFKDRKINTLWKKIKNKHLKINKI